MNTRPPCAASPEKSCSGTRPPHGAPPERCPTGTRQGAAWCALAALASLVDDAVERLEAPLGAEPAPLVPGCHAALDACLELLRDAAERDDLVRTATEDLKRLARLLRLVDGPDVPFVLRQIRRVLSRFDACGGHLAIDRDD